MPIIRTVRNTTYVNGVSEVDGDDLNDLQDSLIEIYGSTAVENLPLSSGAPVQMGPQDSTRTLNLDSSVAGNQIVSFIGGWEGRQLEVWNTGTQPFDILHQSGAGTLADNVICPGGVDLTVSVGRRAALTYDATAQRWRASL